MNLDLMPAESPDSLGFQLRLDDICARFEAAWKAGTPPRLADYVDAVPPGERRELFHELLGLDEYYREKAGEESSDHDYIAQHPNHTETIQAYFAVRSAAPLDVDPDTTGRSLPKIPGFTIERELGRGGMGVVYLARQDRPRRHVVLKMIRDGALAHPAVGRRFQTESEAIARLQHPNIVQVYAVGEDKGRPYMVLEYIPGGGLDRQLDGKPIVPRDAAQMIETLAKAVHYAHQQGVIHRDLKPANVLLQISDLKSQIEDKEPFLQTAIPKIADFGLAKLLEGEAGASGALTGTGEALGTPSYMAPEQARGETKLIGPATDVYALGAILYEQLTGRPPFTATSMAAALDQVIHHEPVAPRALQPSLPRDLDTICLKCLEKPPSQRYATAEALAEDLRRFQDGKSIKARAVSLPERAVRWSRRYPAVAALIATLSFGLAAMTGLVVRSEIAQRNERVAKERARESVEQALVFLAEDQDLVRRGLYNARSRALEAAIRLAEQFQSQANDYPDLMYKLARANYELGYIYSQLGGRMPEAMAATNQAIALLQQLTDRNSDAIEYRIAVAKCMNQRVMLHMTMEATPQAKQGLIEAAAMIRDLVHLQPDNSAVRFALAENCLQQSAFVRELDKNEKEALEWLQRGADEVTAAMKTAPNDVRGQRTAAHIWQQCVRRTRHRNKSTENEWALHQSAISSLERLVEDQPSDRFIQNQLVFSYQMQSLGHLQEDRFLEAEDAIRKALTVVERLSWDDPKLRGNRSALARHHGYLALVLTKQGRVTEADGVYDKIFPYIDAEFLRAETNQEDPAFGSPWGLMDKMCISYLIYRGRPDDALKYLEKAERLPQRAGDGKEGYYTRGPATMSQLRGVIYDLKGQYQESITAWERADAADPKYEHHSRAGRCLALAGLGEVKQAVAEARQRQAAMAGELEPDGSDLFDLARLYGRCCRKSPAGEQKTELAQSAVECLKKAQQLGYFRNISNAMDLENNPDLAPLRNRPDFTELVKEVTEANAKK